VGLHEYTCGVDGSYDTDTGHDGPESRMKRDVLFLLIGREDHARGVVADPAQRTQGHLKIVPLLVGKTTRIKPLSPAIGPR